MENPQEILNTPLKVYVTVNEDRLEDGTIIPRVITCKGGGRYFVERRKPRVV
jgi:hypothetical protein